MEKKLQIGIILCVVIVLIVAGAGWFLSRQEQQQTDRQFTNEVNRNLTLDQEHIYKDRLAQAEKWLNENPGGEVQDRYNSQVVVGHNLYGLGRLKQAREAYLKAVEMNPESPGAYTALYNVEIEMGDNDSALAHIQKAIEIGPKFPDPWIKLIEIKRDRFGASNEELNGIYVEAVVKTGENINILTNYAQFAEKTGNLQVAYEYWKKAGESNKENSKMYFAEAERVKAMMDESR